MPEWQDPLPDTQSYLAEGMRMWSNTRTSTKLYGELTEQCEVDRIPNHP